MTSDSPPLHALVRCESMKIRSAIKRPFRRHWPWSFLLLRSVGLLEILLETQVIAQRYAKIGQRYEENLTVV